MSMHWVDAEELAIYVLQLDSEEDISSDEIEYGLEEKFGISLDQFSKIASSLMQFTPEIRSPLTGRVYRGFIHDGAFIVKREV